MDLCGRIDIWNPMQNHVKRLWRRFNDSWWLRFSCTHNQLLNPLGNRPIIAYSDYHYCDNSLGNFRGMLNLSYFVSLKLMVQMPGCVPGQDSNTAAKPEQDCPWWDQHSPTTAWNEWHLLSFVYSRKCHNSGESHWLPQWCVHQQMHLSSLFIDQTIWFQSLCNILNSQPSLYSAWCMWWFPMERDTSFDVLKQGYIDYSYS